MDETKEKYDGGEAQAREAFDELCAMYQALEEEKEENRRKASEKVSLMRARNDRLREKSQKLRAQYGVLIELYNQLEVEEPHDRSDSSSSEDDSDKEDCCIM